MKSYKYKVARRKVERRRAKKEAGRTKTGLYVVFSFVILLTVSMVINL